MRVAELLCVVDVGAAARERWPRWCVAEPELATVAAEPGTPAWWAWSLTADRAQVDAVLAGLARLASRRGGDDLVAAAVLAWALVPGATFLASSLARHWPGEDVDGLVAAEVWVGVRTWEGEKVAASVLMSARRRVLAQLVGQGRETAWGLSVPVAEGSDLDGARARDVVSTGRDGQVHLTWWAWPVERDDREHAVRGRVSRVSLDQVLDTAVRTGVVTVAQRDAIAAAARVEVDGCRAWRGVCPQAVADRAAQALERTTGRRVSGRTVRRRVTSGVAQMREASPLLAGVAR